ncbi:hypothetical protein E2320_014455, partial [Naja naja]
MPVQIVSRMRHASGRNHMSSKYIGGGWGSDKSSKFSAPSMPVQIVSRMRHASGRNHMSNKNIGGGWGSDKSS